MKKSSARPILLIQSFRDDKRIYSVRDPNRTKTFREWYFNPRPFEDFLSEHFRDVGPLVAIGNPSEFFQPIGAARKYLDHTTWQSEVRKLIQESRFILAFVGSSAGFAWELGTVFALNMSSKLVLIFPPCSKRELEKRWSAFREGVSGAIHVSLPESISSSAVAGVFSNETLEIFEASVEVRGRFLCDLDESHYSRALRSVW